MRWRSSRSWSRLWPSGWRWRCSWPGSTTSPGPRPSTTSRPSDLAIDLLATHRLTRLVTADVLTQSARDRLVGWSYRQRGWTEDDTDIEPASGWADYAQVDPTAPKLATLLTCRWCASVYLGAAVVAARRWLPGWGYVATALAASSAAALLAAMEDD